MRLLRLRNELLIFNLFLAVPMILPALSQEDLDLPVPEEELAPEAPAIPPAPEILPPPDESTIVAIGEEEKDEKDKPDAPKPTAKPEPKKYLEFGQLDKAWDTRDGDTKRLLLTVPIRALQPLDLKKIGLKIFFYDRSSDGKILSATGKITTLWQKDKPDWSTGEEVLICSYDLPPLKPGQPQYLGYWLRVTYNRVVQDNRTHPKSLETQLQITEEKDKE